MDRFDKKVVFITGASSGIGEALARQFATDGADLVLAARRADRLATLAAEIRGWGRKVIPVVCDVTRDGDLEHAVAEGRAALGKMDVVVANAGFGVGGRVDSLALADYRRQFETNVFGVLRTIYATLGDLKKTKGRLAVVGSVSGFFAVPSVSAYCMSKFAVRALCESLADELHGSGVSVTHIAPGFVESEINRVDRMGVFHPRAADRSPAKLRVPVDHAARDIVHAIHRRKRQAVITKHGKLLVFLSRHTPWALSPFARKWGKSRAARGEE